MKVMHIVSDLASNRGGLPIDIMETLSAESRQSSNENHVVILNPESIKDDAPIVAKLEALPHKPTLHRIDHHAYKNVELQKIYDRVRPDVVVFWRPENTLQIMPFLKALDVPLIVKAHTTYDFQSMGFKTREAYRQCFALAGEKNGRIICNSLATRDWNREHFGAPDNRQHIVHSGIDLHIPESPPVLTREKLGIPEDAYVVSSIGTALFRLQGTLMPNFRKDPFGFMLAAGEINKRHPNTVFIMCGRGASYDHIIMKKLMERANMVTGGQLNEANFKMLDHVENIHDIYKMTDVLMALPNSEAFGRTVAEAMKYGVPSIVTNTGVLPYMNGSIAHVVPQRKFSYADEFHYLAANTPNMKWLEKVIPAFEELYQRDSAKRDADAEYLKEHVRTRYDIERVAAKQLELYDEVVHGQGRDSTPPLP